MDDTIQLNEIAGYLPYELQILDKMDLDTKKLNPLYHKHENTYELTIGNLSFTLKKPYRFPLLRPLSDLLKEITHEDKKFIPLLILAGIASYSTGSKLWSIDDKNMIAKHESGASFYFTSDKSFIYKESDKWKDFGVATNQLQLFQKLYEWHFDIHNLIGRGLAVDINSLKD